LSFSSGTFTYAFATLHLERKDQSYVALYIISAVFFVMVSYTGCWVSLAAVPARAGIAVVSLIIVFNTRAAAKREFPPFSYSTWLTDFIFVSAMFNLIMVFEFAAAHYGTVFDAKCAKEEAAAKAKAEAESTESGAAESAGVRLIQVNTAKSAFDQAWKAMIPWVRGMKNLDLYTRWGLPLAYLIFIIIMFSQIGNYR